MSCWFRAGRVGNFEKVEEVQIETEMRPDFRGGVRKLFDRNEIAFVLRSQKLCMQA
jgi:hypothetical protein